MGAARRRRLPPNPPPISSPPHPSTARAWAVPSGGGVGWGGSSSWRRVAGDVNANNTRYGYVQSCRPRATTGGQGGGGGRHKVGSRDCVACRARGDRPARPPSRPPPLVAQVTPGARVALRNDSYTLHVLLPTKVDPLVSLMKVEKVPDSTYDMVGGLDQQIKEIKEVRQI